MQPNCPGSQDGLCLSSWNRNSTRTGKPRKNRTRIETFWTRKNDRNLHSGFNHARLQISAQGRKFAISHGSNQLFRCWPSKFQSNLKFKGTCEIAESRNVRPSIWLVLAIETNTCNMLMKPLDLYRAHSYFNLGVFSPCTALQVWLISQSMFHRAGVICRRSRLRQR